MALPLRTALILTGCSAAIAACDPGASAPSAPAALLTAVSPRGADTGVATTATVTVQFDRAMPPAMAAYTTLHSGGVTGPLVPCTATWSPDSTRVMLMPDSALGAHAMYTLHLGGGMHDAMGGTVDLGTDGTSMGGRWATSAMMAGDSTMGGGQMGGGQMGGGQMGGQEMGSGWAGPNGTYGMVFSFTTR
jgi:hypothetical protein